MQIQTNFCTFVEYCIYFYDLCSKEKYIYMYIKTLITMIGLITDHISKFWHEPVTVSQRQLSKINQSRWTNVLWCVGDHDEAARTAALDRPLSPCLKACNVRVDVFPMMSFGAHSPWGRLHALFPVRMSTYLVNKAESGRVRGEKRYRLAH